MNKNLWRVFAGLCALAMSAVWALPARAQMSEVKEKPPMYSYVSFWNIPRAQWAEMAKADAADQKILDKAVANGTVVGYGNDVNLVHQPDGATHDDWWSAMSMAGVLNVLDQFYKSGSATTPVLASATKHWDGIFVSRYYNWHSGSWKDLYTHGGSYKLKASAPDDAVGTLAKNIVAPLLEKMLADGTIHEYEIDRRGSSHRSARNVLDFLPRGERGRPGQGQRGGAGGLQVEPAERPVMGFHGGLHRAPRLSGPHQRHV